MTHVQFITTLMSGAHAMLFTVGELIVSNYTLALRIL